jgi:membrane dipeptidase
MTIMTNFSNGVTPIDRRSFLHAVAGVVASNVARLADSADSTAEIVAGKDPLLISENPVIVEARNRALAILKPSRVDLEHGLELHRQSLVFDSYGFAPRSAPDGTALTAADSAGATDAELQDLREEMGMIRAVTDHAERVEFEEAMRCSGVTCIFQNAGEEGQSPERLLKRLARFTYLGDMLRDVLVRATTPDDIESARKTGKHCLYLTGNGVPLAQQWNTVEDELNYIRLFFQLGIRMMHVTYNRRNMLGDGCAETANGGLSDFGRAAINEMNRVGVIVDVAHSGWRTSVEAAQISRKPMVASHTSCDAINHHIRAKPDEVIRAICDTGGLVGICCIPNFLGRGGDISALLDHIDHVVTRFGIDHVAIGTDVSHTSQHTTAQAAKLTSRGKRRDRFEALWPPDALGGQWPQAASLGWTNWPLFTVGLIQRGYTDEKIRKIVGENILRVCRAVMNR